MHDLGGRTLAPGLIDAHVHFLGGGGGDGFDTRAPELALTDLTLNAITTVVGAPGIDMVSRTATGLLAKARGLHAEGLSAFLYVGGFHRELRTLTGLFERDIYLVPEVIGLKVAVGESRARQLTADEIVDLARELAWLRRATGRGSVLHLHLGLDTDGYDVVRTAAPRFPDPARVVVTHCNFSEDNLALAIELARTGIRLDVTTMLAPNRGVSGAVPPAAAVRAMLDAGIDPEQLSMSSDGNGHVPDASEDGWEPYETNMDSLFAEVRAVAAQRSLEVAMAMVSRSPAAALDLPHKGRIVEGADADLIVLDESLRLVELYARGRRLVHGGSAVAHGRFENKRRPDATAPAGEGQRSGTST